VNLNIYLNHLFPPPLYLRPSLSTLFNMANSLNKARIIGEELILTFDANSSISHFATNIGEFEATVNNGVTTIAVPLDSAEKGIHLNARSNEGRTTLSSTIKKVTILEEKDTRFAYLLKYNEAREQQTPINTEEKTRGQTSQRSIKRSTTPLRSRAPQFEYVTPSTTSGSDRGRSLSVSRSTFLNSPGSLLFSPIPAGINLNHQQRWLPPAACWEDIDCALKTLLDSDMDEDGKFDNALSILDIDQRNIMRRYREREMSFEKCYILLKAQFGEENGSLSYAEWYALRMKGESLLKFINSVIV